MLGNDQSPASGHTATATASRTERQGRSSSTTDFATSLRTYAVTVPSPTSTVPAIPAASRRRSARHPTAASSSPSRASVPSVAASSSPPHHSGPSATHPVTARYPRAEAPSSGTGPRGASHSRPRAAAIAGTAARAAPDVRTRRCPCVS
ncbi:hypothetical protein ACWGNM_21430 [Streptomyces sp. NPDC055796]